MVSKSVASGASLQYEMAISVDTERREQSQRDTSTRREMWREERTWSLLVLPLGKSTLLNLLDTSGAMKLRGTSKQSQRSRARGTKARERKTSDELGDHGFLLEESHESMSHSWREEVGEEKEVVEDSEGPGKAEKESTSA